MMVIVKGGELVTTTTMLEKFLREKGVSATVGASACLLLFATLLKGSGHPEQLGHDALDQMFLALKMEKPS